MLSIARQYLNEYRDEAVACRQFAADLMRGDPEKFKAGYTRENAVIATAEAFDLSREYVDTVVL